MMQISSTVILIPKRLLSSPIGWPAAAALSDPRSSSPIGGSGRFLDSRALQLLCLVCTLVEVW